MRGAEKYLCLFYSLPNKKVEYSLTPWAAALDNTLIVPQAKEAYFECIFLIEISNQDLLFSHQFFTPIHMENISVHTKLLIKNWMNGRNDPI